jgi:hypothetical protein
MFKHFKRRWSDTGDILREMCALITWRNAVVFLPGAIVLAAFVVLMMQFEDYDEIDEWESDMESQIKRDRVS